MKLKKRFNITLTILLIISFCCCGAIGSTAGYIFKEIMSKSVTLVSQEVENDNITVLNSTKNINLNGNYYYIRPQKNILGDLSEQQNNIGIYNSNVRSVDNQVIDGGILDGNLSFSSTLINGKNVAEEKFIDGYLSFAQYGNYHISKNFEKNKIDIVLNGEKEYSYEYNDTGRIIKKYFNNELIESYDYNDNREINKITDHKKGFAYEMVYSGDKLSSILQYLYRKGSYIKMKHIQFDKYSDENDYAEYNNEVLGVHYLTSKISGNIKYEYEYLNNIAVRQIITYLDTSEIINVQYLFDAGLNRIGFVYNEHIYYYVYDIQGNVASIINENGEEKLNYKYNIIGKAEVSGSSLDLAYINSFAFRAKDNWIYDYELQQYYESGNTYSAKCGIDIRGNVLTKFSKDTVNKTVKNGVIHTIKPSLEYVTSVYDKIENIIFEQSGSILSNNGYDTYSNAISVDEEELEIGKRIDIVALPKERNSFSTPISYEIINISDNNSPQRMTEIRNLSQLSVCVNLNGEYYEPGLAQFGVKGHFVFENKYIKFSALPNTLGVISYNVEPYSSLNFDKSFGNLYNYDSNQFIYFDKTAIPNKEYVAVNSIYEKIDYDALRNEINAQLDASSEEPMVVKDLSVTYISEEYIRDIINNSNEPTYIGGRTWDEMLRDFGTDCDMVYYDGELRLKKDVPREELYGTDWGKIAKDVAIGTGVIIIGAAVTAVTGGGGFACFVAAAATMVGTSALSGTVCATIKGAETGNWSNFGEDFAKGYKYTAIIVSTAQSAAAIQGITFIPFACFTAGTPIAVVGGSKSIENIQVGDYVESYNFAKNQVESKLVTNVFKKQSKTLVKLKVNNEIIETTAEHPFYVDKIGWVEARNLSLGDKVKTHNGKFATIDSKEINNLDLPINVYNFEVEGNHNYFVGNSGVLVHNTCGAEAAITNPAALQSLGNIFKYITSIGAAVKVGEKLIDAGDLMYNGTIVYQEKAQEWNESRVLELEKEIDDKIKNNDKRIYYKVTNNQYDINGIFLNGGYTLEEAAAMLHIAPHNFITLHATDAHNLITYAFGCYAIPCLSNNNVIEHYHPSLNREYPYKFKYEGTDRYKEKGYSIHSFYLLT